MKFLQLTLKTYKEYIIISGGHFEYNQHRFSDVAESIQYLIDNNVYVDFVDEYGRTEEYPLEIIDKFKEAAHWCNRAAEMVQRIDWLVSGDDGEESFLSRWEEEVRKP